MVFLEIGEADTAAVDASIPINIKCSSLDSFLVLWYGIKIDCKPIPVE